MAADSTSAARRGAYDVAALAHLGLIALIAAILAFVVYTGRPRRSRAQTMIPFSMTPPRVELGEYFTIVLDFPASPKVEHAHVRVACYSAVRTVLWKQWSGGAFFAQRDDSAPADMQRLVFKGRFPSEAELWSSDVDPYAQWIWRIEASAQRGGAEWTRSFDVADRPGVGSGGGA